MKKIIKGDEIIVLSGRDKGKRGTVTRCIPGGAVLVQGINRVKKNVKPNPMKGTVGGVIDKELPVPVCKIAIYNAATEKADRVGFKSLGDGSKVRIYRSSGELVKS